MGGVACLGFFVFLYVSIQCLFAVIPPNHVGVRYNSFTKDVDYSRVFEPGRHFTGPLSTYILFPTTVQFMKLKLITRTNDGFPVTLGVTIEYQLKKDMVIKIY